MAHNRTTVTNQSQQELLLPGSVLQIALQENQVPLKITLFGCHGTKKNCQPTAFSADDKKS